MEVRGGRDGQAERGAALLPGRDKPQRDAALVLVDIDGRERRERHGRAEVPDPDHGGSDEHELEPVIGADG